MDIDHELIKVLASWIWPLMCFGIAFFAHRTHVKSHETIFGGDQSSDFLRNVMLTLGVLGLLVAAADTLWYLI
jgi:hypothetical protein